MTDEQKQKLTDCLQRYARERWPGFPTWKYKDFASMRADGIEAMYTRGWNPRYLADSARHLFDEDYERGQGR